MNESKLCESAYLTSGQQTQNPALHGAAMIDRTSGMTHVYLVRGKSTDSVVGELHRQLIRTGRLPRSTARRGTITSALLWAGAAVLVGLIATLLTPSSPRC